MLQPETKTIGGEQFQFIGMDVFQASCMDTQVMSLVTPLIGGLESVSESMEMDATGKVDMSKLKLDFGEISRAISSAFLELDPASQKNLIRGTMKYVQWISSEEGAVDLNNDGAVNRAFQGKLHLMYQVMFEAWRFNKFTPFALFASFGSLIPPMDTLLKGKESQKGPGVKLEKSGPLTPD